MVWNSYKHNFGIEPSKRSIDSLDAATLDRFKANTWLLSPPCQPYTQGGKRLDDQDPRALPLLHLIDLLMQVSQLPDYVFLENVRNFETSRSREKLVGALDKLEFEIKEFTVSPLQFGIANDRKRYYLAARKRLETPKDLAKYVDRSVIITQLQNGSDVGPDISPISTYLERLIDDSLYRVPDAFITKRRNFRFDILQPSSLTSSTITKAYGTHHVIGSGPLLQTRNFGQEVDFSDPETVLSLGLRFLTPLEVGRLHCFPMDSASTTKEEKPLEFPPSLTIKQQWKLLGNSLNVKVVGDLMTMYLFTEK